MFEPALLLVALATVGCLLMVYYLRSKLSVPGPRLRDYLPGGLVYPMYEDGSRFTETIKAITKEYGDVYQMRFGISVGLVTSVPEDILHILGSHETFPRVVSLLSTFKDTFPGGILSMSPAPHKGTKKLFRESFNHSMLQGFHSRMTQAINELCDSLRSSAEENSKTGIPKPVDFSREVSITTFHIITNVAFGFGMNWENRQKFSELVDVVANGIIQDYVGYPIRQALTPFGVRNKQLESRAKIRGICEEFVNKRLQETRNEERERYKDMLDTFLDLEINDPQSPVSMTMEFAVAGSHTTTQSIAWAMYELCCHPEVSQRLNEELSPHFDNLPTSEYLTFDDVKKLDYLNCIWKETLRVHSAVAGIGRQAHRDVTLRGSGIHLPKGTLVFANITRSHTHEKRWDSPQKFDSDRWDSRNGEVEGDKVRRGTYMPFSTGPRVCAGRFLADYEGPLILAELFRRFQFKLACEPQEVVNRSLLADSPRTSSKVGGPLDRGLPILVSLK